MTIDTSREAVERLIARLRGQDPIPSRNEVADEVAALLAERNTWADRSDTWMERAMDGQSKIFSLTTERDALLARAEAAEAREQALLTSYDEERKALVESASLRERLKAAEELLQFIAEVAPVADKTCDEPGITFVEACRREMKERGK